MIGREIARQIAVGDGIPARLLDLSGGENAVGVAVEEHSEEDLGRIRRSSSIAIARIEYRKVELFDNLDNETGKVRLRKAIAQSYGAVQHLFIIGGFELSTHGPILAHLLSGECISPTSC